MYILLYIYIYIYNQLPLKHPAGSVTGVRKWSKLRRPHSEQPDLSIRNLSKKSSVYFWNDNPSITSASKRATATFSHIFFNASAVASNRFLPVHSHRHWKERMHFHIWGLRAWPFFDGKLPGMVWLRCELCSINRNVASTWRSWKFYVEIQIA